jgi:hypothetical protein
MAGQPDNTIELTGPSGGGVFSVRGFLLGLPIAVLVGVVTARIAEIAQSELKFAPFIAFPLLLGGGLGAVVVGLIRLGQLGNRFTILLATVLAVGVAVVGEHYFPYREALKEAERIGPMMLGPSRPDSNAPDAIKGSVAQALKQLAQRPAAPGSFVEYLRQQAAVGRPIFGDHTAHGMAAWLTWWADALLVLAAALAMVVPALRQPYCNRCRTWYRTIRAGRIDGPTGQRLAAVAGVSDVGQPVSARYRLASCKGGCGPTRFEFSWERGDGATSWTQTWLDAARRNRTMQLLDEALAAAAEPDEPAERPDQVDGPNPEP